MYVLTRAYVRWNEVFSVNQLHDLISTLYFHWRFVLNFFIFLHFSCCDLRYNFLLKSLFKILMRLSRILLILFISSKIDISFLLLWFWYEIYVTYDTVHSKNILDIVSVPLFFFEIIKVRRLKRWLLSKFKPFFFVFCLKFDYLILDSTKFKI